MRASSRVPVILAGYLAAVVVASLIVISPFWVMNPLAPGLILFLTVALAVTTLVSLIPALLIAIHAERTKVRGLGFYLSWGLVAGGIGFVVMIALIVAIGGNFVGSTTFLPGAALVMAGAGTAGGLTYWAIAGRNAGLARSDDMRKAPEA
jgi:hypothetical protein